MAMQAESLEVLEKASVPAPQARAIVRAIEIEIAGAQTFLATKPDLLAVKQDILAVVHALELKIEIFRGELRAEIHSSAKDVLRQMYAALLGQTGLLLGIAYFFVTHLKH